jgi:protein dithiol oxidoreductase (disulfide-forming)
LRKFRGKRMIQTIKLKAVIICIAALLTSCQQESDSKSVEPTKKTVAVQKTEPVEAVKSEEAVISEEAIAKPTETAANETVDAAATMHNHSHDHNMGQGEQPVMPSLTERYEVVEPQVQCEKPVVIEFYAYHCPHCYNLEPAAEAWREKIQGKVDFVSVPTDLGNRQMVSLVLLHHAAKNLNILEKTKKALFHRFHVERKLFGSEDEAAEFLVAQGAEKAAAVAALKDQKAFLDSYNIDYKLLNQYKIASVPKILVNHKYMTDITLAGGHDEVFELVDELLTLESGCSQ